jgi:hypothetical protein
MPKTRAQIAAEIAANLPDNSAGDITPTLVRTTLSDISLAAPNLADDGTPATTTQLAAALVTAAADATTKANAAQAAAIAASQPLDSDLTAIAALSTTSFGRSLLELANAAAGRIAFALGTAATSNTGDFDAAGAAAAAQAASQPLDSDLTAIAALTTTTFGRALLTQANAAATRATIGAGTSDFDGVFASLTSKPTTLAGYGIIDAITAAAVAAGYQPLDADLTALAALSGTNTIYYRSAANTWTAVNIGPGMTFSGGTLDSVSGGSGTVTSVSVATANGVSGSVANPNTTPAITIVLGAITPTSVNGVVLSGSSTPTLAVTGTTAVSGTNTGDQTSVSGNAGTATALATARNINGVAFNGTANITVTAAADTLTGTTLPALVGTALTALNASNLGSGTVPAARMPALTGDITSSAGAVATTLATVNSNVGTFGSATKASVVTVNAKGLVTAASESTVTPAVGSITGLGTGVGTALAVNVGSAGAPVLFNGAGGTPTSLTLTNATGLPVAGGGTGAATLAANNVLLGNGTSAIQTVAPSTAGFRLTSNGTTWQSVGDTYLLEFASSDETTAITAGTTKFTTRVRFAGTLTAVRASVTTAPTGSTIIIDVNKNGTTVLSTKLSIDASEKTSVTAATPAVISVSSFADDDEVTIDFDQVGSTIAGTGVKIALYFTRT